MPQLHQRKSIKMICNGMSLTSRVDLLEQGKFPYLQNVRIFNPGEIRSRPGLNLLATCAPPTLNTVHTIKTLVDKALATFTRIAGAGTNVYAGNGNPNLITGGFSGKPLSIVDYRPEESISPYAYIADELKMVKISSSSVLSPFGITAPKKAATVAIDQPSRKTLDNFTAATIANWTQILGSAGAAATVARFTATTIAGISIDEAVPSFASIVPTTFWASMQEGAIVSLGGASPEDVFIEKVQKAVVILGVATVSSITYDVGTTGACTITLSMGISDLEVDSVLKLNGAEFVRVSEVVQSLNNQTTFKTKTVGTIAVGHSVEGFASFRGYLINSHAAADAITADALKTIIGASGLSGIGRVFNLDLTNTGTRALSDDDIFHLSVLISDNSKISEIQIQLDIDEATNDFTKNYFYKSISPNFLTASSTQTIPTIAVQQQAIQRRELQESFYFRLPFYNRVNRETLDNPSYIDDPENPNFWRGGLVPSFDNPDETSLGQNQWTEIIIPLKEFIRVGSDTSKGLKDVKSVRVTVNANAGVDLYLDSMWIGGGFGLSNISTDGKITPYSWVYCYEEATTKAVSDWSPPMRNGLFISRGRAKLLAEVSAELAVTDRIIWARFGGNNNDFRLVGVQSNDGTVFYDEFTDSSIAQNPKAIFGKRKPFAILDIPRKGVVNVNGNKVTRVSGDSFNLAWALGSQIIIDNIPTHLFTSPTSTTALEIEKDLGTKANVKWYMPDALLVGQPLPIIFGPFALNELGLVIFGLGDKNAAGKVYWLDPSTPDTQNQFNFWEVCSPAEPLMNGVMYDGIPFVWSTERSYMMIPSFVDGQLSFYSRENANSKGLFARYAICVGNDFIYYLSSDGINKVQGVGNPISITDRDLYNLFPRHGMTPTYFSLPDGIIIRPPDFTLPNEMRLYYVNKHVFFRYKDTLGAACTVVYNTVLEGWISFDTYNAQAEVGAFYEEEGDANYNVLIGYPNGQICNYSEDTTFETSPLANSVVLIPSDDMGDSGLIKLFSDAKVDVDLGLQLGTILNVTPYFDNNTIVGVQRDVLGPSVQRTLRIINLEDPDPVEGVLARNISAFFYWPLNKQIKLYEFQPSFVPKTETLDLRIIDFDDAGFIGEKFWQGIILKANTFGQNKIFTIIDDEGIDRGTILVNQTGEQTKAYSFDVPFIAHQIKLVPLDDQTIEWNYYAHEYKFDKEVEIVKTWETQETTHGLVQLQQLKTVFLSLTSTANVTLSVIIDGVTTDYIIPSTGGFQRKEEVIVKALKGNIYKYRLVSEVGFRLYKQQCEVLVKSCGSPEPFQTKNPFGDTSNITGAVI